MNWQGNILKCESPIFDDIWNKYNFQKNIWFNYLFFIGKRRCQIIKDTTFAECFLTFLFKRYIKKTVISTSFSK